MRDWLVHLPDTLTESDLLDMVEGTLPNHREPVAIAALKAEPRLGLLIKQMRMDKAALAGAPVGPTPEALADSVLAEIDARVLRSLAAESQEHSASIPIHSVLIDDGHQARAVVESRLFRTLSLAAAIVLVAGLGAYIAREYHLARNRAPNGFIASSGVYGPPKPDGPAPHEAVEDLPQETMAQGTPGPAQEVPRPPDVGPSMSLAIKSEISSEPPPTTSDPAPLPPPAPEPQPVTVAEAQEPQLSTPAAARFAREGRLALVVRPKDQPSTLRRLEALARIGSHAPTASQRELVWSALDMQRLPAQYAALAIPTTPTGPAGGSPQGTSPRPALAGDSPAGSIDRVPGSLPPLPGLPSLRPVVKAIYTVQVEPSERGLDDLLRAIGEQADAVTYRVLPTPLVEGVSWEPDSILWWTGSTTRWARPSTVPVIVEGRE